MNEIVAVLLIISYVMPGRLPDIQHRLPEPTIEECWTDAKEFVKRGIPKVAADKGAIAVMAACREVPPEGQDG